MRLNELYKEKTPKVSVTLKNAQDWIKEIRTILGTQNSPMPKISYDYNIFASYLGTCTWQPGLESIIKIHKKVQIDMPTFKRVIAHELCHDAVNMTLNVIYKNDLKLGAIFSSVAIKRLSDRFLTINNGHGPEWQEFASKINAQYGPKYVTQFSDETYVYKKSIWER